MNTNDTNLCSNINMLHNQIDLNLFNVLKAIYLEGSITLAAQKLHLTQPAVSHALSRLRDKYRDPMFVRQGKKMVASEFTQSIMPQVLDAVRALEHTLTHEQIFDINLHNTPIKLGFRDILESLFFPPLLKDLTVNSPNIKIHSQQISHALMEKALTEGELDLVIDALLPVSANIDHQLICNEHFVLVCREHHPILSDLTLKHYLSCGHIIASLKDNFVDTIDVALAKHSAVRNVVLQCEHFFAAANVLLETDLLLTMPNTYAEKLAKQMSLIVSPLPFNSPNLPVHMYWHKQAGNHPVNKWLKAKLFNIGEQLFTVSDIRAC